MNIKADKARRYTAMAQRGHKFPLITLLRERIDAAITTAAMRGKDKVTFYLWGDENELAQEIAARLRSDIYGFTVDFMTNGVSVVLTIRW